MLATGLLRETPHPTDAQIRDALAANLCRCTGYQGILRAARSILGLTDGSSTRGAAGDDD